MARKPKTMSMQAALQDQAHPNQVVADFLLTEIEKVIVGQRETLRLLLATVLTRGHVLLEDRPGVGKTVLARSLGALFGLEMGRIQGTPDLLPTDITGVHIFNPESQSWDFRAGPVFSPLVLVDELNRATAKAQSALLEAMAEGQVTVDGETMQLPQPFMVIATQNPHGDAGTHRLGAAQLDRFAVQLSLGLPGRDAERAVIMKQAGATQGASVRAVSAPADLPRLFGAVDSVSVDATLINYALDVVEALRDLDPQVWLSVRVSETVVSVAKGFAYMNGRSYVAPEDIQAVALPVVRHRMPAGVDDAAVLGTILAQSVPVHGV